MQVVPVSQKLIPHIWRFPLYSFDRHQIAQSLLHGGPQLVCKHLLNLKLKVKLWLDKSKTETVCPQSKGYAPNCYNPPALRAYSLSGPTNHKISSYKGTN